MNEMTSQALTDVLNYLRALNQDGLCPQEARARHRVLQERHPETGMDLLWEEEAYDGSFHYDVLLHFCGEGTVSLSFCPDRALPWPLRGVHRWSEKKLVRVNGTILEIDQAVACLDFIWDEAPIMDRLVNVCLIQQALQREPIELSHEELQHSLDAFRRTHGLCKAEDTRRWMERRGVTHEKLERLIADEAKVAKLRDRVVAGRVDGYFDQHRADFDTACIAQIEFSDEGSAQRTCGQIRSGAVDFYAAGQHHFLEEAQRSQHSGGDIFAVLQRRQTPPELGPAVFAAAPGQILGPLPSGERYAIVRVLSLTPARLDEATRAAIKKILFEEWLEQRRQEAKIEWYWGNADRTPPVSGNGNSGS